LNKLHLFKARDVANTVWAFARAGASSSAALALFEKVAIEAPPFINSFNAQDLSNTAWAYATAGVDAPDLFEAVAQTAPRMLNECNEQEMATLVWSFAKARVSAPALFECVAVEAVLRVATFTPRALAVTAWAFSRAGVADDAPADAPDGNAPPDGADAYGAEVPLFERDSVLDLFEGIAFRAESTAHLFHASELACLAWAFSSARLDADALFKAVATAVPAALRGPQSPSTLTSLAAAFAMPLRIHDHDVFEAIALRVEADISRFKPHELAEVAWAFAAVRFPAPGLFEALAKRGLEVLQEFDGPQLALIARAFAISHAEAPLFLKAVGARAATQTHSLDAKQLGALAEALRRAHVEAPAVYEKALRLEPIKFKQYFPDLRVSGAWKR